MMTKFSDIWQALETEARDINSSGILKRMVGNDRSRPTFLGIKKPGMKRAYILQIPKDIAPLPEVIPESKGFDFTVMIAGDEIHSDHVSLILSVSREDYNDIFSTIAEDLYSKILEQQSLKETVTAFLGRVRLWQIFFERQNVQGLSDEAQRGLYGELFFLNKYLLSHQPAFEKAIGAWTGPKNRQHDFQFGNLSVEVKVTSAKQHQKIKISSEQQLDSKLIDKLYVFYISVSLIENYTDTLPALIKKIRSRLEADISSLTDFNNGLLQRGYLDIHEPLYQKTGYSLRETAFFLVNEHFPRIVESDLRPGVGDVAYSVSITECKKFEIEEQNFIQELESMQK